MTAPFANAAEDPEHPFRAQPRPGDLLGAGVRLHYLEWGPARAPTVLLLHGAALTAHTWDVVCDLLAPDFHCVAVDLRGHGDSEWPHDAAYGLDAYADDVEKVADWFGLDQFVLVGMSLGGLTALTYAARAAARLRGLVLVDSGPTLGRPSAGASRLRNFVDGPEEYATVDEFVERALAFNPLRSRERLQRTLLFNLRQTPHGTWTWKYDRRIRMRPSADDAEVRRQLDARRALLRAAASAVACPTLVVRGGRSDLFLAEDVETTLGLIPRSRALTIPGAGHTVQGDRPYELAAALREFLEVDLVRQPTAVSPGADLAEVTVDLSDLRAIIAAGVPEPEQTNYTVSRDAIRHIAYATDEYNALYLDEEFARTTRWRGIIAPPGYLYSHGQQFLAWPQLLGRIVDSEGHEFDMPDNMGDDWEFFQPVRPGDVILSHSQPLEPVVKRGRQLGVFVLTASESRFVNQRGELVATMRGATARWSGRRQADRGHLAAGYPTPDPERAALARTGKRPPRLAERHYNRRSLAFEDVQVGTQLPELAIGPFTSGHIRQWEVHVWNNSRPEGGGMLIEGGHVPNMYAAGVMRIPWFGRLLIDWAGPNAWIRKLAYRNREWVLVGFNYVCRGEVTAKYVEDGRHYVECALRIDNELGAITNTGTAVLELPSVG